MDATRKTNFLQRQEKGDRKRFKEGEISFKFLINILFYFILFYFIFYFNKYCKIILKNLIAFLNQIVFIIWT
jgi:hypothetical protein